MLHITTTAAVPGNLYRQLPRAPEAWVVEHLLPAAGLANIFGAPKGGKSFLALQLAAAISTTKPDWMTFPIRTTGPVLYLQLDTPRSLWAARLDTLVETAGLDLSQIYFADAEQAPYPFDILGNHRDPLSAAWTWLREQVSTINPVVVIVDTLRELHSGDENDSGQMRNVMAALGAAVHPAALVLLSHSRKDNMSIPESGRENLLDDNRGSNYISGRMDGIVRVSSNQKHSRLTYQSRTIERHVLKCTRLPGGLWAVDGSEEEAFIQAVLADTTMSSLSERAEALGHKLGRSTEAARSILRRRVASPLATSVPIARPSPTLDDLQDPPAND